VREDVKMRRCEDEKMRYRHPLLEEPCAQTLSGKTTNRNGVLKLFNIIQNQNLHDLVQNMTEFVGKVQVLIGNLKPMAFVSNQHEYRICCSTRG